MSTSTPKKIGENQYQIDADSNLGMKVPVRIYADEPLLQKMLSGRTITQAQNVSSIPGIVGQSIVLPDDQIILDTHKQGIILDTH